MNVMQTKLEGVTVLEPRVFSDARGFVLEMFNEAAFRELGLPCRFAQINRSQSKCNVLRGLHYQIEKPQGKLISVVMGEIYDVAVDLRRSSSTFGRWCSLTLSSSNCRQLYIPPGMAHGFCVLSEVAEVIYQCTEVYSPRHERTIRWNDPDLAISWPVVEPLLSARDASGISFGDAEYF